MILKRYKKEKKRDNTIYFCDFTIIDGLDDAWQEISYNSIEGMLVAMLDEKFSHEQHFDIVHICKCRVPLFADDTYGGSSEVYLVKHINNGQTDLLSTSRIALEIMLGTAEHDPFNAVEIKESNLEISIKK